ncbi:conserved hypothetical protein [Ferrimonas balearica DSM 9799]|uniref:Uncharacterized protein n=1 Tax=Ferrimonas balearica (strain DSM 9799 / CCM 4581 / KCTC 23876 / PAT) TaxID=550540 RepID=E1SW14_FERBD|nr:hypothetical protein [Ferrimonas balearica]MBY6019335.1 hypothetical protein [Halomonas denitrificans]ADN74314.1 conserved hypothetical protein [Ferrimonas balearica DSM 9799]MBW3141270.1 hypothetical protein [Ferrimonas balearica]MBW3166129.1 hypothetical protein [Ferrimonas balearica]MBY5981955.1 hypothetical protein [Ferrimonas balearica]
MTQQGSAGNVLAAICSFFIAGLGQLVQGRILAAFLFFIFVGGFYALAAVLYVPFIIAIPLHIWCIVDAARYRG